MQDAQPRFLPLAAKTAVCHTITYFFMGMLAFHFLHYADVIARPCSGMRQMSDPMLRAGVLFQPLRGVLFALVFYPLRGSLFGRKRGWLLMGWMLVALGILGTFAAPPGSMEGLIYTTVPVAMQLRGWLEIVPQALLLSALLCYWVNNPAKKWLGWVLGVAFSLLMAFFVFALFMPMR
jgi:high-affinity Fe2+/Pb2+ permease